MGARAVMESRLLWILTDAGIDYEYVGRPLRASPGEGYSPAHKAEQARILREALDLPAEEPAGEGGAANGAASPNGAGGDGGWPEDATTSPAARVDG